MLIQPGVNSFRRLSPHCTSFLRPEGLPSTWPCPSGHALRSPQWNPFWLLGLPTVFPGAPSLPSQPQISSRTQATGTLCPQDPRNGPNLPGRGERSSAPGRGTGAMGADCGGPVPTQCALCPDRERPRPPSLPPARLMARGPLSWRAGRAGERHQKCPGSGHRAHHSSWQAPGKLPRDRNGPSRRLPPSWSRPGKGSL